MDVAFSKDAVAPGLVFCGPEASRGPGASYLADLQPLSPREGIKSRSDGI
jgi:hypothetical protein